MAGSVQAAAVPVRREVGRPRDPSVALSMNEKRFSPSKLAVLTEVLAEAGVPPEVALAGTGLDAAAIATLASGSWPTM